MKKRYPTTSVLSTLMIFVFLTGCGGGGGGGSGNASAGGNDSRPSLGGVSTPATTITSNTGSQATSSAITWLPPTQNVDDSAFTDLVGYKIYIGSEPDRFEIVRELKEPGLTEYVIEGVPAGTYYVAMTAVNSQNIESPLSNVVVKVVGDS